MPLADAVTGMLRDEHARFWEGVRDLNPESRINSRAAAGRKDADPTQPRTINIPAWDDVIKLGAQTRSTKEERNEFYSARTENRPANLSSGTVSLIQAERARAYNQRQSAQPESSQAWGSIMTAIDNVQDFTSTLATAGRLGIWAAPRIAAGLGIERTAIGAALGAVGLRAAMRVVPVVGTALLIGDLLNLLNLLGMLASPIYGLLCQGPKGFLAAAAPTLLFKRGLKQEVWKKATTNPFGRDARVARRVKALNGRLGFAELIEVAQTTQQLFGYGVSFGAVVGVATEAAAAAQMAIEGTAVRVAFNPHSAPAQVAVTERIQAQSRSQQLTTRQAAAIAATAPAIMRVQEHFTDEIHVEVMLGYHIAMGILRDLWRGIDVDDFVGLNHDVEIEPPLLLHDFTADHIIADGIPLDEGRKWWFDDFPRRAPLGRVMDDAIERVPKAVNDFLLPRRNNAWGVFFGTLVTQETEILWHFMTEDDGALRWQLSPDYALLASLAESGFLLPNNNDQQRLWRLWKAAKKRLADRDARALYEDDWRELAARYGVVLWQMKRPLDPWPATGQWPDPDAESKPPFPYQARGVPNA